MQRYCHQVVEFVVDTVSTISSNVYMNKALSKGNPACDANVTKHIAHNDMIITTTLIKVAVVLGANDSIFATGHKSAIAIIEK